MIEGANEKAGKAELALVKKEKEKEGVQGELDDLLMVFGDLEDKVERYKEKVKELGGEVSEGEEEEEDGDVD